VTTHKVVVDDTHRLHEGVHRGRPDERPALILQSLRESRGRRGAGGQRAEGIGTGQFLSVGERPDDAGEGLARPVHGVQPLCVVDRRLDLASVTDDARVREEFVDFRVTESGDFDGIESCEGVPERFTFSQNGDPRETALKSFEADLFEESSFIGNGTTPFVVVVRDVDVAPFAPRATLRDSCHGTVIPFPHPVG